MDDIPHEVLQQGGFVGPRFTGVFLFQNIFWRVSIPLVIGACAVNALDALRMMPADQKRLLCAQGDTLREYLLLWADCWDYDAGFQASHMVLAKGSFLGEMIVSTDRELTSAIADLCQQRPNSRAMHGSRDTTEKALKAHLCHHGGLTADHAKKYFGHKLDQLIQEVAINAPQSPLAKLANDLKAFAPYDDRYTSTVYSRSDLWRAYRVAQFTAAEVLRTITGKSHRAVVVSRAPFK